MPSQERPGQLGLALRVRRPASERAGGLPVVLRRFGRANQVVAAPHAAVLVQAEAVVENHVFVVYHAPIPPGKIESLKICSFNLWFIGRSLSISTTV